MKDINALQKTRNLQIMRTGVDGGMGIIYRAAKPFASVIWSNGGGWEHISISPFKRVTPSWADMCELKDMFFNDDEVVVQYHPAKSEYVNNKDNCLHLWRPINEPLPTPPSIMVGIKDGMTAADVRKAVKELI